MSIPFIRKRSGFCIALLLFILSSSGSIYAYGKIVESRTGTGGALHAVPIGEHSFELLHESKCVGHFSTKVERKDDAFNFTGDGIVRIKIGSTAYAPQLRLVASFNSLGQLGGSFLKVRNGPNQFTVGTTNVNPIKVIIKSQAEQQLLKYELSVPGPITLTAQGNKSVEISYPYLANLESMYRGTMSQPMLQGARIEFAQAESLRPECLQQDGPEADLSDTLKSLGKLEGYAERLLQR